MEDNLGDLPSGEAEAREAEVHFNRITATAARATAIVGSDWRDDASCASHPDPELWFPSTGHPLNKRVREAKAICRACPVKLTCLRAACLMRPLGIWGATTHGQRKDHKHDFDALSKLTNI
ncbi:WhiB family transcriptional regulator [Streptomyces sp. NBC_00414]|uniref:WhiB family transcriptional regulator n=1 Tax=Streptomyces sp. NBC_00414 TaxID=2975739 RepID=UPI003FA6DA47